MSVWITLLWVLSRLLINQLEEGKKLRSSAVKNYAAEHKLHLLQPENLKSNEFTSQLHELSADIFVVVAFRMMPKSIWSIPKHGTFNLHASLLPQY